MYNNNYDGNTSLKGLMGHSMEPVHKGQPSYRPVGQPGAYELLSYGGEQT